MKQTKPKPRIVWGFNPVSRTTVPSKKRYNRKKAKAAFKKSNMIQYDNT